MANVSLNITPESLFFAGTYPPQAPPRRGILHANPFPKETSLLGGAWGG